ncbi:MULTISPECIES: PatA/PatG family cyanobactin maturation protease [unclassified Microcystis]|uniref:PatA/PatG family cyanobactin maturation protease n=1 Tax=Microcystis flos-aquae Mf_QC_C_20070823_S10D TaxID=2486236 RepID=A0A552L657_9CHRO|nr:MULTISPECIES: PatA/PatG family cyanobactin maturation protease [unclassified Microcystis]MCA2819017.1 PatA/PatG family cyanobactin maturation protease [Microcystis sp. M085S1]MCA2853979.1 PatA/PatG family cyanobactin maturation protease [Microcystis sp. M065S1]TRT78457.1 MAG: PatA/PatG family cyanobactin maturation protease [Microcystis flos-aquae Ma_QC_C_20070823_S18]TRU00886.1 MAG: PatA/PatG family cyanobactin maturation protease [Microcystis flos-aquae Ma_QC_C_20070823_S18D]TRV15710.1 MA
MNVLTIPGLKELQKQTKGAAEITVAILDGVVDTDHPCFNGADLTRLPTLVQHQATAGQMSTHGTHIASLIFGQPKTEIEGIAPQCRGLLVPVFSDDNRKLSQLDLARAIEQAAENGAKVINISGGALTDMGEAEDWLIRAVEMCNERNILLVAAAGNDGCECLQVPAALPAVLAVGAVDARGHPLDFSNWGETYQSQGILAPGENILGAKPGGGTVQLSGTSFAAPIVAGVAALLLSLQVQRGETPNPHAVREAILKSALPCQYADSENEPKCLAGLLNISGAIKQLTGETMSESVETQATVEASGCGCGGTPETPEAERQKLELSAATSAPVIPVAQIPNPVITSQGVSMPETTNKPVTPSQAAEPAGGIVYAIGTLGYDFGSEARRDTFKQLMPTAVIGGIEVPSNPYDARQIVDYLADNLSEAKSLIWTLNLELTPVYAIEPLGSFSREVYAALQELLSGQVQAEDSPEYIQRVSIPGRITGRTVRLFSGQVVPVIEPDSPRGIYGWHVNTLVSAAIEAVGAEQTEAQESQMRRTLSSFLNRIYYDLRNLGQTSQDRALNFAATNAFQAAQTFSEAVGAGMELDSINVSKSPFCRLDSDCWDVQLKFFDPENSRRARKVFRFTIDVSDLIPVTLGEVRSWSSPN